MSTDKHIQRIVVGLDSSQSSLLGLELATRLAAALRAELAALFVEDINLLHLAGLPFSSEISTARAQVRPLSDEQMSARMRAQAAQAKAALASLSDSLRVQYSFSVSRGVVTDELLAGAQGADLVVLGANSARLAERVLGSSATRVAAKAHCAVLLAGRSDDLGAPVVCLLDASSNIQRVLGLAMELARLDSKRMTVVIVGTPEQQTALQQQTQMILRAAEIETKFLLLTHADVTKLKSIGGRLLVVSAQGRMLDPSMLQDWYQALGWPILIAR